jgi:hypothetical protein
MSAYITWGLYEPRSGAWLREWPTKETAETWAAALNLHGFVALPVSLADHQLAEAA